MKNDKTTDYHGAENEMSYSFFNNSNNLYSYSVLVERGGRERENIYGRKKISK